MLVVLFVVAVHQTSSSSQPCWAVLAAHTAGEVADDAEADREVAEGGCLSGESGLDAELGQDGV
ncbi:hypothetical protein GCM10010384_54990 [Streptomyces djakartensis]|uniref:Secreted protein n=1 Tax=Streptomyces djakartensis TaxID=68193 RepID=A0ABQ3ACK5_9ACTN|nr:hypothetical protein GCM10010384_54990 [Streptomyces djakartensis]